VEAETKCELPYAQVAENLGCSELAARLRYSQTFSCGTGSIREPVPRPRSGPVRVSTCASERAEGDGVIALGEHLQALFARLKIDCVIDVGAHLGQFGRLVRRLGYEGTIISFEPVLAV